ncbi:MAG: SDR family NAD(P)-dependent oxidoreductase, partial [Chloroflexota bacterium]
MLKIMIVGATSAIAHETARNFAADGASFFLVARSEPKLDAIAADLRAYGAQQVDCTLMDMNDFEAHGALLASAMSALDGLDVLLVAHGTLSDQAAAQSNFDVTMQEINTNFLSTASLLTIAADHFENQRRGVIAVISSVAGDRGRGSNYVYGTAMAAKTTFLSGLRNRLAKSGVQVVTVKPG